MFDFVPDAFDAVLRAILPRITNSSLLFLFSCFRDPTLFLAASGRFIL